EDLFDRRKDVDVQHSGTIEIVVIGRLAEDVLEHHRSLSAPHARARCTGRGARVLARRKSHLTEGAKTWSRRQDVLDPLDAPRPTPSPDSCTFTRSRGALTHAGGTRTPCPG